jgi:hypothetical protein
MSSAETHKNHTQALCISRYPAPTPIPTAGLHILGFGLKAIWIANAFSNTNGTELEESALNAGDKNIQ